MAEQVRGAGPDEDRLVRALLDASPAAVVAIDAQRRIFYVNPRLEEMFGYTAEELVGAPYEVLAPERLRTVVRERVDAWFDDPEPMPVGSGPDVLGLRKDGTEFVMQYAATPVATSSGLRAIGALIDVSQMRRQEARLESLRRSYVTLARLNGTVVRAQDADSLLSAACAVAVEESGFSGAWVGRPRPDGGLEVVARCGVLEEETAALDLARPGTGPTASALDTGRAVYAQLGEPGADTPPWQAAAYDLGLRALACLPLRCQEQAAAVLTLYDADPDAFDAGTRRLLEEVATNVSFALEGFANTEQLHEVAVQRRDLLARLVTAQEAERDRIAADLHRDAVPTLELADRRLEAVGRALEGRLPDLRPTLDQVRDVLSGATESLRHLSFDLETPQAGAGLEAAIRDSAEHVFFDPAVRWQVSVEDVSLSDEQASTALRILKEALVNVRKHARASQVRVEARASAGGAELRVVDDGIGFDPEEVTRVAGHRGLVTMAERARMAGGWLRAGRAGATGSEVVLWLPPQVPDDDLAL